MTWPIRTVSWFSKFILYMCNYVRRDTPDSRMAVTLNANIVSQHSVTTFADRLSKSTRRRSPDRVLIDEVGSLGTFRRSNAMVKLFVRKLSRVMFGILGKAFWNM